MPVLQPVLALATAFAGVTVSAVTTIFASSHTDLAPWAQVGGTATAVAALGYVAKLLADGRLTAQPVAELLAASSKREDRLADLVEMQRALVKDSHARESDLRSLLLIANRDYRDRSESERRDQ